MRPRTLAEACGRATSQGTFVKAIQEFLDVFYRAEGHNEREHMLEDEPALFTDECHNALVGGLAEFLYKRFAPSSAPDWIGKPQRYLDRPWFPSAGTNPGLREYLTWCSPPEFKSRNIMTDAEPFRRASLSATARERNPTNN